MVNLFVLALLYEGETYILDKICKNKCLKNCFIIC